MTIVFRTRRLLVRPFTPADAPAAFAMWADPQVRRHTGDEAPRDESVIAADIERWRAVGADAPGCGFWAACAGAVFVGDVFVRPLPRAGECEIGWHLARPHWGQGYATELARGALGHARAHGIRRLVALIDPGNVASLRVAEKAGMVCEGETRRYDPDEPAVIVYRDGDPRRRAVRRRPGGAAPTGPPAGTAARPGRTRRR